GGSPFRLGELYPETAYHRLEATTPDGWSLTIGRIAPGGSHVHTNSPVVSWRIPSALIWDRVTFQRDGGLKDGAITDALMFPLKLPAWPRGTQRSVENPYFGCREDTLDWLEYEAACGRVAVMKVAPSLVQVKIVHGSNDIGREIDAVGLALSHL